MEMTYAPLAHLPRSTARQRSLQKGYSASLASTIFLQVGQRKLRTFFFVMAPVTSSQLPVASERAGPARYSTYLASRRSGAAIDARFQRTTGYWLLATEYWQLLHNPRHQIVVVCFGDLATIELTLANVFAIAKIVHVNRAINVGSMHRRSAFPQQLCFGRGTRQEQIELLTHESTLSFAADLLLQRHEFLAASLNLSPRNFVGQCESPRPLLVGVTKHSQPVELRLAHELAELFEIVFTLARETHNERGTQRQTRNRAPHLLDGAQEDVCAGAAFHALQNLRRGVLQGHVNIGANLFMRCNRLQQLAGDLVGIGVEEAHPAQFLDLRQPLQQQRQPVFQTQIFSVAGGILPDQRDLAHALVRKMLRLGDHRFESPRTKLATQLRDDAKRAGMIAAFGDLDVGRILRSRQQARRVLVVQ